MNMEGFKEAMASSKINFSKKDIDRRISNLTMGVDPPKTPKKIRQVKLHETHKNQDSKMRRLVFKDDKRSLDVEKTVMVVGPTGSGKTTVLDAIFNYVKNVAWEDDFRWKLTDLSYDEKNKLGDQTVSQTEWITVYEIPKLSDKVPFRLNLIDTPGFGDTRGVKHDKEIVSHMSSFFNHREGSRGIMVLDAVCFVVKAPDVRLTETQKYIFHSVLSIFGKDIVDNMFLFATFADMGKPKVYKALRQEKVEFVEKLRFNNSMLYASCTIPDGIEEDDDDDDPQEECLEAQKVFWDMGMKSFEKFFQCLLTTEPTSTEMTRRVLKERLRIQFLLDDMKVKIRTGVKHLQCLQRENSELKRHLEDMAQNENFSITLQIVQPTEVSNQPGTNALYCKKCKATCHYPCVKFKIFKYFCQAFTSAGLCSACQTRSKDEKYMCTTADHEFRDSHIEDIVETNTQTREDIRSRHERATGRRNSTIDVLDITALQYRQTKTEVDHLIDDAHECYVKLNEISLRENPLHKSHFIDHLMEQEDSVKLAGYMERKRILCDIKQDVLNIGYAKDRTSALESIRSMEEMDAYLRVTKVYHAKAEASGGK